MVAWESFCTLVETSDKDECQEPHRFVPKLSQIDFSSTRDRSDYGTGYAQGLTVDGEGYWQPDVNAEGTEFMQVDLGRVTSIAGLVTRGAFNGGWSQVTAYVVRVSDDREVWTEVECGRIFMTPWEGHYQSRDKDFEKLFTEPVVARYVRVYPMEWYSRIAMRMQVLVCKEEEVPAEEAEEEDDGEEKSDEECCDCERDQCKELKDKKDKKDEKDKNDKKDKDDDDDDDDDDDEKNGGGKCKKHPKPKGCKKSKCRKYCGVDKK
eukprot:737715-Rhodomonas_salina.1